MSRKDAIKDVARLAGLPKREVYDVVHARGEDEPEEGTR